MIEEGEATGEQHDVQVEVPHEFGRHLPLVHPGADGLDQPLLAELHHGRQRRLQRLPLPIAFVLVGIVQVDDVGVVHLETVEAFVQRSEDALPAHVEDHLELR